MSEEPIYVVLLESTSPTPTLVTLPDLDSHNTVLPTNKVPQITYYRRNLKKEIRFPIAQPTSVQGSEPPQCQGMTNSIDSHVNNKMGENDRSNTIVSQEMSENDSVDETEVIAENVGDEAEQDHLVNLDEYGPSLNIPIALRKGTRSY